MPSINYKKNKQSRNDLDLLLLEMWFLSNLKNKKIRFNPEAILNFFNVTNKQPLPREEKFVNLHFEIVKKVDALISKYESELKTNEPKTISTIHQDMPISNIIEKREPSIIRQPEIPVFNTEIIQNISFGEIKQEEDFFEIVEPPEFIPVEDKQQENEKTSDSFLLGDQDKSRLKFLSSLGRIKVRNTNTQKQQTIKTEKQKSIKTEKQKEQINGILVKKEELEKTRQEIEARKKALKNAIEKEKKKKVELKKQRAEKKRAEKLQKLELKRLEKEKKIQKLKEEKQKQMEKEREEKLKAKKIKEQEIAEKQKQIEREREEKLKAKKIKEQEIAEKQKEKEKEREERVKTKIKKEPPVGMDTFIKPKKEEIDQYDRDVEKLIPIIDGLLEKLPDDVIDNFAHSKDFVLYEKVINKYKNK